MSSWRTSWGCTEKTVFKLKKGLNCKTFEKTGVFRLRSPAFKETFELTHQGE